VGGVVTVREGYNPRQAIVNVKQQIAELSRALPARAVVDWQQTSPAQVAHFAHQQGLPELDSHNQPQWQNWLRSHPQHAPPWLTLSQVTVVPFYDRTLLIDETLGTLNHALVQQLLVTLVVILVMLGHLGAALSVGLMLPAAVLLTFIAMKVFGVEANIVALAGIAIAIGSIVDMGIIVSENVLRQLRENPDAKLMEVIYRGTTEVSSALFTAIATTVISFLPVFAMSGAEGKLFTPLAYTKTFVLLASVALALTLVPMLLHWLLRPTLRTASSGWRWAGLAMGALLLAWAGGWGWLAVAALLPAALALWQLYFQHLPASDRLRQRLPPTAVKWLARWPLLVCVIVLVFILAATWEPLGPAAGTVKNTLFIGLIFTGVLGVFALFLRVYARVLLWCLDHKALFLSLPVLLVALGLTIWLGFDRVFSPLPFSADKIGLNGQWLRNSAPWQSAEKAFPGLGREFMPALDEGSFLWMPSTMPHASISEVQALMRTQNKAIAAIAEVSQVVGKAGRADTALDPAPLSMLETIIHYHSEYITDANGKRLRFAYDSHQGEFERDSAGELIIDSRGRPYRQWREHIQRPEDIWQEIVAAASMPGSTSAPRLQPIETRLLMLQTGMRAAMGLKLTAPDLGTLEQARELLQRALTEAPGVAASTLNAERLVGKPWLEIHIDRERIARYGLSVNQVQNTIAAAIGGVEVGRTLEGRERYSISVRYPRELRQTPEQMQQVRVSTPNGAQIPLGQLADIRMVQGPEMIRTENTFLTSYITFGGEPGWAEVGVVEAVSDYLNSQLNSGELHLPAGVSYSFAGNFENQQRAAATLMLVIPLALVLIFMLLYLQFRAVSTALIVFSGVAVAWAGGFILLYLYGQSWFGNFSLLGVNMRELFQLQPVNLSIAVWVGFLALFGIAVDDGVVMGTYLKQHFAHSSGGNRRDIRQKTLQAAQRRVRPCLMTSATTILALLPVLTATGRGADLMIPMAIPTVGGLSFVLLSMFVVPVLYAWVEERKYTS
ncbi:MAG TPA: efflux RND transporter permease subunit, partial [Cellvibrionaceae bacterium]